MRTDTAPRTSQKLLSVYLRRCRIRLFNKIAEPPCKLEQLGLCGDRAWNTAKFMEPYQQVKLLHIAQIWTMSWLRMMIPLNSFALLGEWGWRERRISVTNSCKYWHFSFLQKKRTILSISRPAGNCQQKVEASPETWSARLPLDLQNKAICKEELNVWITCCLVEPDLRLCPEAWEHSVLCSASAVSINSCTQQYLMRRLPSNTEHQSSFMEHLWASNRKKYF